MHQLLELTCLPDIQKSYAIAHRTNAVSVPEFLGSWKFGGFRQLGTDIPSPINVDQVMCLQMKYSLNISNFENNKRKAHSNFYSLLEKKSNYWLKSQPDKKSRLYLLIKYEKFQYWLNMRQKREAKKCGKFILRDKRIDFKITWKKKHFSKR